MSPEILSHTTAPETWEEAKAEAAARILENREPIYGYSQEALLELLDQLTKFDFGRKLLVNKGLDAASTALLTSYPNEFAYTPAHPLEKWIFERCPVVLATRERMRLFREAIAKNLRNGDHLVSLPCGTMNDIAGIQFKAFEGLRITGIDLDPQALAMAKRTMEQAHPTTLQCCDAWELQLARPADILVSNGLNFYVSEDERLLALYKVFFDNIAPKGILITSTVAPPVDLDPKTDWRLNAIDRLDVEKQAVLFKKIIASKWRNFRTAAQTARQLQSVGFGKIQILSGTSGMIPTILASKG